MRKLFISAIVLGTMLLTAACSSHNTPAPLRVMTFNIRLNVASDGANAWPNRKELAASMFVFHHADIVGVQEALHGQMEDLDQLLPEYDWIGVGRDDGAEAGEYSAIWYRPDRLEVLHQETFWLSETPDQPGFGWDASYNRVVTWARFRDRESGAEFYVFNTHFDNRGEVARRESAKMLLDRVAAIAGDLPVIVTGDFNSQPDSEPYRIITDPADPEHLTDSKTVSQYPHHGPNLTFSGFENIGAPGDQPIDYIFIKGDVRVLLHGTLSDTFDGRFPSDHMPVLIEAVVGE